MSRARRGSMAWIPVPRPVARRPGVGTSSGAGAWPGAERRSGAGTRPGVARSGAGTVVSSEALIDLLGGEPEIGQRVAMARPGGPGALLAQRADGGVGEASQRRYRE